VRDVGSNLESHSHFILRYVINVLVNAAFNISEGWTHYGGD
jgi:hypothetical protein